jgi:hypothetical protein
MKKNFFLFLFSLSITIFSCNSSNEKAETKETPKKETVSDSSKIVVENKVPDLRLDCVRGQATSILKKDVFKKSTFAVQADSLTGIEIVELPNGDKLSIKNWGCEYYVLSFRFETSRFQKDTSDLEFWFDQAQNLMMDVEKGIDAPIDLKGGIQALNGRCESSFHMNYESFNVGDEVDFGDGDMRTFAVIDRIQKISEKKYAVEISFSVGPL